METDSPDPVVREVTATSLIVKETSLNALTREVKNEHRPQISFYQSLSLIQPITTNRLIPQLPVKTKLWHSLLLRQHNQLPRWEIQLWERKGGGQNNP